MFCQIQFAILSISNPLYFWGETMAKYKIDLSIVMAAQSRSEVVEKLTTLLSSQQWEMGSIDMLIEEKPLIVAASEPVNAAEEVYVTFRVADERFRLLASDFGIKSTELKVLKSRDFLHYRIKAFLEESGYKVEQNTNLRVVAESHVENIPQPNVAPTGRESEFHSNVFKLD